MAGGRSATAADTTDWQGSPVDDPLVEASGLPSEKGCDMSAGAKGGGGNNGRLWQGDVHESETSQFHFCFSKL